MTEFISRTPLSLLSRALKGATAFFIGSVVARGGGFLLVLAMGNLLDVRSFGLLMLALTVTRLVAKVFSFGMPNVVLRFMSGPVDEDLRRTFGSTVVLTGVTVTIGAGGMYVLSPIIGVQLLGKPDIVPVLEVLSISAGGGVLFTIGKAVLQAREMVRSYAIVDSAYGGLQVVASVVLVLGIEPSAPVAAYGITIAYALAVALTAYMVPWRTIAPSYKQFWSTTRTYLSYSAPLLVVGFGYFVAQQADRLMLGALDTAESVGVYSVASTLAFILTLVHQALGRIMMPMLSEAYSGGDLNDVFDVYTTSTKWVAAINGVALLVFVVGGEVLLGLFGPEFRSPTVHIALIILSTLYFIGSWVGPTGVLLQMTDGHRLEAVNTLVFVVMNLALNYVLILDYGVIGAAVATTVSGCARNGLQLVQIVRIHGFFPIQRSQWGVGALVAGGSILLWVLRDHIAAALIVLVTSMAGLIYLCVYEMTNRETELFHQIQARVTGHEPRR